jgi:hypothetical protein
LVATVAVAQFRLGPVGGFNFNRQIFKSNTYRYEGLFKNQIGFNVGLISDLTINKYLFLQSELIYTRRGGFYTSDRPNIQQEYQSTIGYISLPICLTGKLDLNKGYLIAGVGPYLSTVLHSGRSYYSNGENIQSGKMKIGTRTTDDLKPFDAGMKFKAGFELKKGFYTVAYYDLSSSDINPGFTVTRNKTFGVQFGYIFSLTEEDRYNRFEHFYEF